MNAVFAFPGQGSQHAGMLDAIPEPDALDRLLDAAEALTGRELRRLADEGTTEELRDTVVAQPLIYLACWTWGSVLIDVGLRPVAVAGHSLGELAALAVAGVYSPEAGLELVCERARLMAECAAAAPGAMSAVLGLSATAVEDAIAGVSEVWVANDNAPAQVVISGTHSAITEASEALLERGAKRIVPLDVAGAFHTPLMHEAAARFADLIRAAEIRDATIPVAQNTRPTPSVSGEEIREALIGQMDSRVRWTETMVAIASAYRPVTLIETGPGSVLTGLARRIEGLPAVCVEETGVEALIEEVLR
ncbi:MAG TPA: ACP S-malonyltransferase [Coriobacteriia bacterium]|nr:ACP S-malonyltransferase [Coriobacteriia bacterium]